MQKYVLLGLLLCILLSGCGTSEEGAGIEFYTLRDEEWVELNTGVKTSPHAITDASETAAPAETDAVVEDTEGITYILNTSSKKFHNPACSAWARSRTATGESLPENGMSCWRGDTTRAKSAIRKKEISCGKSRRPHV